MFVSNEMSMISCRDDSIPTFHLISCCSRSIRTSASSVLKGSLLIPCFEALHSISNSQFDFDFINVIRVKEFQFRPLPAATATREESALVANPNKSSLDNENENLAMKDVLQSPQACHLRAAESVWNIDGELVEQSSLHVK